MTTIPLVIFIILVIYIFLDLYGVTQEINPKIRNIMDYVLGVFILMCIFITFLALIDLTQK